MHTGSDTVYASTLRMLIKIGDMWSMCQSSVSWGNPMHAGGGSWG